MITVREVEIWRLGLGVVWAWEVLAPWTEPGIDVETVSYGWSITRAAAARDSAASIAALTGKPGERVYEADAVRWSRLPLGRSYAVVRDDVCRILPRLCCVDGATQVSWLGWIVAAELGQVPA